MAKKTPQTDREPRPLGGSQTDATPGTDVKPAADSPSEPDPANPDAAQPTKPDAQADQSEPDAKPLDATPVAQTADRASWLQSELTKANEAIAEIEQQLRAMGDPLTAMRTAQQHLGEVRRAVAEARLRQEQDIRAAEDALREVSERDADKHQTHEKLVQRHADATALANTLAEKIKKLQVGT